MTAPWLTDAQLAGPHGTRRVPQIDDLLPALKVQRTGKPLVQLEGYPVERWRLSPFVWGLQNMADNLEAATAARADAAQFDAMLSEQARRFDVNNKELRNLIREQRRAIRDFADTEPSSDPPPPPPPPPGASANDIATALRPLFTDVIDVVRLSGQNTQWELQQMRREGGNPDADMEWYGSSDAGPPPSPGRPGVRRSVTKTTRNVTYNRTENVTNHYYPQSLQSQAPEHKPNTGAAEDIDMVNPPGPKGPPPPPGTGESVSSGDVLSQFSAFAANVRRSNEALAEQLTKRDIEAQAQRHLAEREQAARMQRMAEEVAANIRETFDKIAPEVVRATTAHTLNPDPRVEQLIQAYASTFDKIQQLMQQGFRADPDEQQEIRLELEHARAQQLRLAAELNAFNEMFRRSEQNWVEQVLQLQAAKEELQRQVEEARANRQPHIPTREEQEAQKTHDEVLVLPGPKPPDVPPDAGREPTGDMAKAQLVATGGSASSALVPARKKRTVEDDEVLATTLMQLRDAWGRGDHAKLRKLKAIIDDRGWVSNPAKRANKLAITYLAKPKIDKEITTAAALTKAAKQAPLAIEDVPRPVSSKDGPEPAPREGGVPNDETVQPMNRSGRATRRMTALKPAIKPVRRTVAKPVPAKAELVKQVDVPEEPAKVIRRSGRSGGSRVK